MIALPRRYSPLAFTMLLTTLLGLSPGCVVPDDGNDNGNDNSDPTVVVLDLGTTGVFTQNIVNPVGQGAFFDIRDRLPGDAVAATLLLEAADVTVASNGLMDSNGEIPAGSASNAPPVEISVLAFLASADAADPCRGLPDFSVFDLVVDSNGVLTVDAGTPFVTEQEFDLLFGGAFGLCLAVAGTAEVDLAIERISVSFTPPGPVTAESCAEILALPEVQAALTSLTSNGFAFNLPTGDEVPDLTGSYTLTQETTFDPDGDNEGDTVDGNVQLRDQTETTITRAGFDAELDLFVQGDATSIGFCALERTNVAACDQTIARLESLVRDDATGDLVGTFVSVAVRRHDFTDPQCGARGDFIYGTIALSGGASMIARRATVALPDGFAADLLAVASDDSAVLVTSADEPAALRITTTSPFSADAVTLPTGATGTRFGAIGIDRGNTRMALALENPARVFTYEPATLDLIRATEPELPDTLQYFGDRLDFTTDATRVYVPGTDANFADRISVIRTDDSDFPDQTRRLLTPNGSTPVQARVRPDGNQAAVLFEVGAPVGEADQLSFINTSTGTYLTPPIDLEASAGGTVLASELVYSPDGSLVFMAGLGAVVALETSSPYDVFLIDVSDGAGDNPVSLALSNDGEVLAVAVDDAEGDADFAVIDVETLEVINTQDLPGIGNRRALGVAHFGAARVAVVANFESTAVAVRTESPFTADEPILLADDAEVNSLGRIAGGANVIAITNLDAPEVYLLELTAGME